jgi:nucleoside-diphosphate-sugar epimerase
MKFILTGTSGFIGSEILSQLLQKSSVTCLIILSRRPLPELDGRGSRIKLIVLDNFLSYPDSVVQALAGAKACLWALGGSNSNPTPTGKNDEVEVQYPLTAAKALLSAAKLREEGTGNTKLRFLFISGTLSERNQSKSLWFLKEGRKARVSPTNEGGHYSEC